VLRSLAAKLPVTDFNVNSAAAQEIIRLAGFLVGEEYKPRGKLSRLLSGLINGPKSRSGFDLKGVNWEDVEKKYI
jgi:hypothetical protein